MKNKLGIALALVLTFGSLSFTQNVRGEERHGDQATSQQKRADDPPKADDKGRDAARDLRDAIERALKLLGLHP